VSTDKQQFKPGDRVEWLGFVKANAGEPERPIGKRGNVTHTGAERRGSVDVVYVQWDDEDDEGVETTTWVENVRLVPGPVPVDSELRERLIVLLSQTAPNTEPYENIIAMARAFETYILGDTK
jgi:hypothetical protein